MKKKNLKNLLSLDSVKSNTLNHKNTIFNTSETSSKKDELSKNLNYNTKAISLLKKGIFTHNSKKVDPLRLRSMLKLIKLRNRNLKYYLHQLEELTLRKNSKLLLSDPATQSVNNGRLSHPNENNLNAHLNYNWLGHKRRKLKLFKREGKFWFSNWKKKIKIKNGPSGENYKIGSSDLLLLNLIKERRINLSKKFYGVGDPSKIKKAPGFSFINDNLLGNQFIKYKFQNTNNSLGTAGEIASNSLRGDLFGSGEAFTARGEDKKIKNKSNINSYTSSSTLGWTTQSNFFKELGSNLLGKGGIQENKLDSLIKEHQDLLPIRKRELESLGLLPASHIDFESFHKLLKSFFNTLNSLISLPVIESLPDRLSIRLFYYLKGNRIENKNLRNYKYYVKNSGKLFKEIMLRALISSKVDKESLALFLSYWKKFNNERIVSELGTPKLFKMSLNEKLENSISSVSRESALKKMESLIENLNSNSDIFPSPNIDISVSELGRAKVQNSNNKSINLPLRSIKNESNLELENLIKLFSIILPAFNSLDIKNISNNTMKSEAYLIKTLNNKSLRAHNKEEHNLNMDNKLISEVLERKVLNFYCQEPTNIILNGGPGHSTYLYPYGLINEGDSTMVKLNLAKLRIFIRYLEKLFNKTIQLDLTRLHYPYHESNILSQVIGKSSKNRFSKFYNMMKNLEFTASVTQPGVKLYSENSKIKTLPSLLSGFKVKLAGRLLGEGMRPRFTVRQYQVGTLSRAKIGYKNTSRFTFKNKRGAYSLTITMSHIFENINSKG